MMAMRANRHRKAQNGGLLRTSPVPIDYIRSANHIDFSDSRQFSSGFHFPSLNSSLGKMSNNKKKAPPSTAEVGFSESTLPEIEGVNLNDELLEALKAPLIDVSRQRLRAMQISFCRLGNLENQITTKELNSVLSEHNIRMPGRTFQLILRKFEGKYGVDFEPLWKFMVQAQSRTGRDSVIAINRSSNGLSNGQNGIPKEDLDLIIKLHKVLTGAQYNDLANLRLVLQENDDSDHGVIPRKKIRSIFVGQHLPLPGPLLNTLIKKCDDEKDGMINWAGCVNLLDQALKFDPKAYEKQKQPKKYQPLSQTDKPESEGNDASTSSPSASGNKSQAAKKKAASGKEGGTDKKTGDKDASKKSAGKPESEGNDTSTSSLSASGKKSQAAKKKAASGKEGGTDKKAGDKKSTDSKAKPASKDAQKTDNAKAKSTRPPTAAPSSRPKTSTTRPGTAASGDSKSSKSSDKDKSQTAQKKDGGIKGQSSNKDDAQKKKAGVRSDAELNNSASSKSTGSNASSKTGMNANPQRASSGKKLTTESKSKTPDVANNNTKGKNEVKSSNANKYTKSTLGGISDLTKGLSLGSDDTEKEYLKQAQARINGPAGSKDKDKKSKDDVNNKSLSKSKAASGYGISSRPSTTNSDSKTSSRPGIHSDAKMSSRPSASTTNSNRDTNVQPRPVPVPRPATAKVMTRPMTAKAVVPPRPATAKPVLPRPLTASSEIGRARSASGRKVVLNRDMEIDFNKVECVGISKEKKESLISIYTGAPMPIPKVPAFAPTKKNSVAPENFPGKNNKGPDNFPGKNNRGSVKKSARDVTSNQSNRGPPLDSSQDSSAKSSSVSDMPNSSSNSLQSTSSSQASNASSDQPLLSSSAAAAMEKKDKESKKDDGKLFKSFKGFLGMGKKKEEPDDKKKLLEIESLSNNSQEGIELRSAAELVMETETKQDMPSTGTPPDEKPPAPPQNSPEKQTSTESLSQQKAIPQEPALANLPDATLPAVQTVMQHTPAEKSAEQALAGKADTEKPSPAAVLAEKSLQRQSSEEKTTTDKDPVDKSSMEKFTEDKSAVDKSQMEKPLSRKSSAVKHGSDISSPERSSMVESLATKTSVKAPRDKSLTRKSSVKSATNKPALEKTSSEKSTEKAATKKSIDRKSSTEKSPAKKSSNDTSVKKEPSKSPEEKSADNKSPEKKSPEKKPQEEKSPDQEKLPTEDEPPAPDPEKADFVLNGKAVSYYIPDEFLGKTISGDAPKESLQLDWVYGYRGNDCRCNMYFLQSGELVYFMGMVAILYDGQKHVQRHYMQHNSDIKSLAVHPNQVTIATGQGCGNDGAYIKACIRIWKSETLETLHVLGEGDFVKNAFSISFAATMPNYLVAVDDCDGHKMSIWDSGSGKKLAEKKIDTEVVCQVVIHPKRHEELISIGKEHMAYWSFRGDPLTIEEINKADYQTNMRAKYIICLTFKANGDLVTGDSNGTVYVWANGGNTITQTIRHAHEGPVFSLLFHKNSLLTGGRDGLIQAWKFSCANGDQIGKVQIPSTDGGIRMLQIKDNTLYIGTTLNGIVKAELGQTASLLTDAKLSDKPITRGHYDNVYQVAANPSPDKSGHFITAGFDGTLMLFDAKSHTTVWKHCMKGVNIQCIDINPSGSLIALGTKDSNLIILSIGNQDEFIEECNMKVGKTPITCIKFSTDGETVAIGSTNSIIHIMRISNEGKNCQPIGKCKGHTGAITSFDWSVDKDEGHGYLLQSSSSSIEYSIWNPTTCQQIDDIKEQKNRKWVSQNCLTGFHVAGAWGSLRESPMITSADRSRDQTLLVAGDSTGDIIVCRYPCAKPEASNHTISAHSTETSCVRYVGDNYVLSTGGDDCTLMQWKIIRT